MTAQARGAAAPAGLPRKGEVRSHTIPHLIHELGAAGATGLLTLTDRDVRKTVQFVQGMVLFASSNDRDDRLNQLLLRSNVVSLPNLLKALELALATKDRLGEVMVRLKMMGAADVEKWVRLQVREIVYGLFGWTRGQYAFEEHQAKGESITLGVPADVIVIEGVRRVVSWARAYEEVGGLNTEYRSTREMSVIVRGLPLLPEEQQLLGLCDAPTSLRELCEASALSDFDVCRSVWALLIVGALMKA
jgi:hypothetical protein